MRDIVESGVNFGPYAEDNLFSFKNFDYPEKPLKYKHIRRISD